MKMSKIYIFFLTLILCIGVFFVPAFALEEPETDGKHLSIAEDASNNAAPADKTLSSSESAVPDGLKPFTSSGMGVVMDNATGQDGKEFFTITTAEGNTFYLIIDRQKSSENVYLLNEVTENDLRALTGKGGKALSSLPDVGLMPQESESAPAPDVKEGDEDNGTIIFIILAAMAVGGIGYYFKILRPKKQSFDAEDEAEYEDDPDMPDDEDDMEEETE